MALTMEQVNKLELILYRLLSHVNQVGKGDLEEMQYDDTHNHIFQLCSSLRKEIK